MLAIRLVVSGLVAFISYAAWAWYANSLVTSDSIVLLKAALVQGSYSAGITLGFTYLLEFFYKKFGVSNYCLPLILPRWSQDTQQNPCTTKLTFEHALQTSRKLCKGTCMPGAIVSPIPALVLQSILVIAVNLVFRTPNLWLTVLPSIVFSACYGYVYSFGLSRQVTRAKLTNS
ncbi:hypothetical protein [Agaribacter flavus]|uniref:Uncharacterized protein n=1 Tax=Agaribacter flavus TaxID=1902781 RepID=A0ABV7FSI7_9ALTE